MTDPKYSTRLMFSLLHYPHTPHITQTVVQNEGDRPEYQKEGLTMMEGVRFARNPVRKGIVLSAFGAFAVLLLIVVTLLFTGAKEAKAHGSGWPYHAGANRKADCDDYQNTIRARVPGPKVVWSKSGTTAEKVYWTSAIQRWDSANHRWYLYSQYTNWSYAYANSQGLLRPVSPYELTSWYRGGTTVPSSLQVYSNLHTGYYRVVQYLNWTRDSYGAHRMRQFFSGGYAQCRIT
jgi:hypothetical protein